MEDEQKVSILLAEYNTLRAEVLAARSYVMQAIGIAAAVIMGIIGFCFSQGVSGHEWVPWTIGTIAFVYLGFTYTWNDINTRSFTKRLRELEADINERAQDTLLVWETHFGWGSMGPSGRDVAFGIGLIIAGIGVIGIAAPADAVWLAGHFVTPTPLRFVAAFRVAFGLLLISVSSASRAPKVLRIVAVLPIASGIATFFLVRRAPALIGWWSQQGPGVARLTGFVLMALGGFIAYACAPPRRVEGRTLRD
jgi:hypothetical protein